MPTKPSPTAGLLLVALVTLTAGCATEPHSYPQSSYPSQSPGSSYSYTNGVVDRIEVVRKGGGNNVAGTVIGGIVGGLIGSQIGGGSGQTAATVAGAVGGAVAGNQIEKRRRQNDETFRISVRMDNGSSQTVMQDDINDLRTGDRVRIEGGKVYSS